MSAKKYTAGTLGHVSVLHHPMLHCTTLPQLHHTTKLCYTPSYATLHHTTPTAPHYYTMLHTILCYTAPHYPNCTTLLYYATPTLLHYCPVLLLLLEPGQQQLLTHLCFKYNVRFWNVDIISLDFNCLVCVAAVISSLVALQQFAEFLNNVS